MSHAQIRETPVESKTDDSCNYLEAKNNTGTPPPGVPIAPANDNSHGRTPNHSVTVKVAVSRIAVENKTSMSASANVPPRTVVALAYYRHVPSCPSRLELSLEAPSVRGAVNLAMCNIGSARGLTYVCMGLGNKMNGQKRGNQDGGAFAAAVQAQAMWCMVPLEHHEQRSFMSWRVHCLNQPCQCIT